MGKTYVLDRVAADLARGFTHPAIQRLSSLVAAYPNDLDLRRRLAAVHRRVGNRVQAGRWDYLTIGADSADTHAFERAYPSAVTRLRKVRWPLRAGQAATAYARSRLAALVAAAEAEHPNGTAAPVASASPAAAAVRPQPRVAPPARSAAAGSARPGRWAQVTRLAQLARSAQVARLAQVTRLARQWRRPGRSVGSTGLLFAAAAAILAAASLVVVGLVTVVEWAVQ